MDACIQACCGVAPRRNVSDLFDRGRRRARQSPLPVQGDEHRDAGGLSVRFGLAVEDGGIAKVGFKASTCITLIAYCELIAELVVGQGIPQAARLSVADLIPELPDVPALKRDRAPLAVAAFRDALAAAWTENSLHQPNGENDEGRLHLRHAAP
jgi:NifU-like protein involved in Fe-S cluster formation